MLLLTFNWKNFFMFIFSLFFFIVMLESPAPFSLNFSSPMKYSSKERFAYLFIWLNGFPIVLIEWLGEKRGGRRPSCPLIFGVLKKATRNFSFLRTFSLVKIYVTYELAYVTNFYIRMFLLRIWEGSPTRQYLALYTKALIFFSLNHKGRRMNSWNY